jgi:hypothetical protein
MSYPQYLRNQASECVVVALATGETEEAASLLDLAANYHRLAEGAQLTLDEPNGGFTEKGMTGPVMKASVTGEAT